MFSSQTTLIVAGQRERNETVQVAKKYLLFCLWNSRLMAVTKVDLLILT